MAQSQTHDEANISVPSPVYRTRAADALLLRTQAAVLSNDGATEPVLRQPDIHVNSEALAPYSRPIRLRTESVGRVRWAALIVLLLLVVVIVARMTGVLAFPGIPIPFLSAASGVSADTTIVPATGTGVSTPNATATDVESLSTKVVSTPLAGASTRGEGFAASTFILATTTAHPSSPQVTFPANPSTSFPNATTSIPATATPPPPTTTSVPPTVTPPPPTNTAILPTAAPVQPTTIPQPPRPAVAPPPVAPAPVYQPPVVVYQPPPPTPIPVPPTATQAPPTATAVPPTAVPTSPPAPTAPPEPPAAPTRAAIVLAGITATPRFPPPR